MKSVSKVKDKKRGKQPSEISVEELNSRLSADQAGALPDTIYLDSDFQFVESEENTKREIDLVLKLTRMEPYDDVLDLCSGQGRHTEELCRREFSSVVGVDQSRILVRMGRKRLLEQGLKGARFSQGDARSLKFSDERFDVVLLLGNSLGSFDKDKDEDKVFSEIFRVLKPRGSVVIEVVDGEWARHNFRPKAYGWNDQKLFVCKERSIAADGKRLISREVVIDPEKGSIAEDFSAERLFTKDELMMLLVKNGFTEIYNHNFQKVPFANWRNLLMMENRLFITAGKPTKKLFFGPHGHKDRREPFPCLALLGDPTVYDPLLKVSKKRQQEAKAHKGLKAALKKIAGFSFSYFDNHQHFAKEVLKKRPNFVFNLCFDGLFNDQDKELHIPALLDAQAIPYSGSDPVAIAQCYDKPFMRSLAKDADILVPDEVWLPAGVQSITLPKRFPVLVMPALQRGPRGTSMSILIHNISELRAGVEKLSEEFPSEALLIQEFLPGNEFSVGVFGNCTAKLSAFPLLENDYSLLSKLKDPLQTDTSFVLPQSVDGTVVHTYPSTLERDMQKFLIHHAFTLFRRLGLNDYAVFNFRSDRNGNMKLLSVKPNPSLLPEGKLAQMATFAALSYEKMLEKLLLISIERNKSLLE